jgi:phosphoribosylanthranilate isomerase
VDDLTDEVDVFVERIFCAFESALAKIHCVSQDFAGFLDALRVGAFFQLDTSGFKERVKVFENFVFFNWFHNVSCPEGYDCIDGETQQLQMGAGFVSGTKEVVAGRRTWNVVRPMPVKVKICGITNATDARVAADAGADMIGFVFCEKSPRRVAIETAAEIAPAVPAFVVKVGVFVNPLQEFVVRAITECGLGIVQFHGDESPEFCTQFGVMSMKAFRIRDAESLRSLPDYETDAWLLDAYSPDKAGGTGATFNWDLAIEAKKLVRPIFLAGGLTPHNIAEAVRRVLPYAVDVSSGVEAEPGKKDHGKVRAFIKAAKGA